MSETKSTYQLLVDADDSCVLSSYEPVPKDEANYQSEDALERRLIRILVEQGTQHLPVKRGVLRHRRIVQRLGHVEDRRR